jgi:hypothetical protein
MRTIKQRIVKTLLEEEDEQERRKRIISRGKN